MSFNDFIFSWAELISILIPLLVIIVVRPKSRQSRPLVFYTIAAFLPNLLIVLISEENTFRQYLPKSNHVFYNIHSFLKVLCFGIYLLYFKQLKSTIIIKILLTLYCLFCLVNYIFLNSIFVISSWMPTIENILLLTFCTSFFLSTIVDNSDTLWIDEPLFYTCAVINFYAAINFFVFLFLNYFNVTDAAKFEFSVITLTIFAYTFILLGLGISWSIIKTEKVKQ